MAHDSDVVPVERLRVLERGTTLETALAFFDEGGPVRVDELLGCWRGSGVPTGHPYDGLLEALGWHGKRFEGPEGVHPLVFEGRTGLFSANPALMPMGLSLRFSDLAKGGPMAAVGRRALPLARTSKPRARLRMMEFRGVLTATMSYDALPINDHFRRVDPDTVIGVMDYRVMDQPFVFVLRREPCA